MNANSAHNNRLAKINRRKPNLKEVGMVRKVKVSYEGGLDVGLDNSIRSAIESIGGKWYGQGMEIETQQRDVVFDLTIPTTIKESPVNSAVALLKKVAEWGANNDTALPGWLMEEIIEFLDFKQPCQGSAKPPTSAVEKLLKENIDGSDAYAVGWNSAINTVVKLLQQQAEPQGEAVK